MIKLYNIKNRVFVENNGITINEFITKVLLFLSMDTPNVLLVYSKPGTQQIFPANKVLIDLHYPNGYSITGTYPNVKIKHDNHALGLIQDLVLDVDMNRNREARLKLNIAIHFNDGSKRSHLPKTKFDPSRCPGCGRKWNQIKCKHCKYSRHAY